MQKVTKKSSVRSNLGRPALTPESRESQMVALAINLAEQQLRDGTASSQVITHYLKLGATNSQLMLEKQRLENELLKAKTEAIQSAQRVEELYANALRAMKSYGGQVDDGGHDFDYEDEYE